MSAPHPVAAATAQLDDAWLHHHVFAVQHQGVDAFLMGLAAFQRGLQVVYHYEVASKAARFKHLPVQGFRGELFSVSDGQKTHFFRRTMGDLTTLAASAQAEDKTQTKALLSQHGIDVPAGIVVGKSDLSAVNAFLSQHPHKRFLLKPVNGTLAQGVVRNIAPHQVVDSIAQHAATLLLLEEHVPGREYRVFVSGECYVAAFERCPASVVGDGIHTLAELAAAKQRVMTEDVHPTNEIEWPSHALIADHLAQQQRHLEQVPAVGEQVSISALPSRRAGADLVDATDTLPMAVQQLCVKAAKVLSLPNTGLDIIVSPDGRAVILEANQNPMLAGSVFPAGQPGHGNRVAESIIDHYFPGSVANKRFPHASFDFNALCKLLRTGVASSFSLPLLGVEWVHRRLHIAGSTHHDVALKVRMEQYRLGIHVQRKTTANGDTVLDVVAPAARYMAFVKAVGASEVALDHPLAVTFS